MSRVHRWASTVVPLTPAEYGAATTAVELDVPDESTRMSLSDPRPMATWPVGRAAQARGAAATTPVPTPTSTANAEVSQRTLVLLLAAVTKPCPLCQTDDHEGTQHQETAIRGKMDIYPRGCMR
ncbi:hypothetical protein Areg01_81960 [Actinoplanes regularis]|nr:hypothetical protein Areg01_81960 [Actinoplanes regularis]